MGEGYIGNFKGLLRCTFMNANGLRIYRSLGDVVLLGVSCFSDFLPGVDDFRNTFRSRP